MRVSYVLQQEVGIRVTLTHYASAVDSLLPLGLPLMGLSAQLSSHSW
jgi:hypothetical protein